MWLTRVTVTDAAWFKRIMPRRIQVSHTPGLGHAGKTALNRYGGRQPACKNPKGRSPMLHRTAVGAVLGSALCAVLAGSISTPARAQDFPTRPITIVVPYPAGGAADLLCRYAGEKASASLGQQVVVENRPGGAGGRIGIEQVLRATPDGYTLLCATQLNYSITHLLITKATVDPRPLEPISVLATYPMIIVLLKDFPANNLK
jgi:hypothetical protein